mmetsp:Transcript_32962/g.55259  ORF Transcript_32962/g.55259 Transcript_32962/m.55259 type:complete len:120 (-) Transcript_32962:9-368(-)
MIASRICDGILRIMMPPPSCPKNSEVRSRGEGSVSWTGVKGNGYDDGVVEKEEEEEDVDNVQDDLSHVLQAGMDAVGRGTTEHFSLASFVQLPSPSIAFTGSSMMAIDSSEGLIVLAYI